MEKLWVCVVSDTLAQSRPSNCLPSEPRAFAGFDVVEVPTFGQAKALCSTHPVACLVLSARVEGQEMAPFVCSLRSRSPNVPVIIYGIQGAPGPHLQRDGGIMIIPSPQLHSALELAERLLRERAFSREEINPCRHCAEPCASHWPRKLVKYLLDNDNFLRLRSLGQVADGLGRTLGHLDRACTQSCPLRPKQLLLTMKLSFAAYLRQATTLPVERIARRCGFADGSHLCHVARS